MDSWFPADLYARHAADMARTNAVSCAREIRAQRNPLTKESGREMKMDQASKMTVRKKGRSGGGPWADAQTSVVSREKILPAFF